MYILPSTLDGSRRHQWIKIRKNARDHGACEYQTQSTKQTVTNKSSPQVYAVGHQILRLHKETTEHSYQSLPQVCLQIHWPYGFLYRATVMERQPNRWVDLDSNIQHECNVGTTHTLSDESRLLNSIFLNDSFKAFICFLSFETKSLLLCNYRISIG